MEKDLKSSSKLADTPAIRGPFKGLIITFPRNYNFTDFNKLYPSLTFEHPNFYFSKFDKHKCIIYYKYSYDVATVLSKYENEKKWNFSIYYDELTKTLQPNVLYIISKNPKKLSTKIEQLNGSIIYKTSISHLIKFEDFKMAAIAHEELRKEFSVKFAYKSEVNKYCNPSKITKTDEEKYQLKDDIKLLIQKYKQNYENKDFKEELNEIHRRQSELNKQRIRNAAENLDFANISWNQAMEVEFEEEEIKESEEDENNLENVLEKLENIFKNL